MAGTVSGGKQAAATNKAKYGEDFYVRMGAVGGSISRGGGFAVDNRTWLEKLLKRPTRAQLAGQKGGKISRRGPKNG